ncbi:MAG: DUF2304 domain-containing protein [Bacilli bacterium]|nr:DUF2304 domain-containing protein [Bacilli bacterium]
MSTNLSLYSGIFCIFIIIFVLYLVRRERINIKYSIVWLLLFLALLIFLLAPGLLASVTKLLGFQTSSNMVFSLLIAVLVAINISATVINSSQDKKIRSLIQDISILKKKLEDKNKR